MLSMGTTLWVRGSAYGETIACQFTSVSTSSRGLFLGDDPLDYLTPVVLAVFILIFFFTRTIYSIIRHFQQSLLTAQIIAGMIMGVSYFSEKRSYYDKLFPPAGMLVLRTFGYFGFMIHIFGHGVSLNLRLFKGTGRKAIFIGLSGFTCSISASFLCYVAMIFTFAKATFRDHSPLSLPLFMFINSVSSFFVITSHLVNLKLINSQLGNIASSIAVVTEGCGSMMAFLANFAITVQRSKDLALYAVAPNILFYLSLFFILRPIVLRILRKMPEDKPMKESSVFIIMTMVLLVGFFGDCSGQSAALGVFIFGLALPDESPLGNMMQKFDTVVSSLLLPIFCTLSGLRTNMFALRRQSSPLVELIIIAGYVGKFTGVLISSVFLEMPFHDALPLALLLCCKGLAELGVYGFCRDTQLMTEELFTLAMITMVVVTGILLPAVKYLYDPSTRYMPSAMQTILHTDHTGVFRILVCIHREENVPTMVDLLNISNPTKESPVCVFVLQLLELVGHRKATLAPHNLSSKPSLNKTHPEHVVNAFTIFEQQNQDNVKVHHFLGIAPYTTMHNDICTIAHDKGVSIIIVPFHKQWGIDGRVDSSHMNIKNVNQRVLQKAPCSVGVLVDRGPIVGNSSILKGQSLFSIAMLFLGGDDDHEALAYSRRMAEHPYVRLQVIRIRPRTQISEDNQEMNDFDKEIIDDFLSSVTNKENITYHEALVDDGVGTTGRARSLENHIDLVLVGRHHEPDSPATSGLAEWSECPELGAIGDMLATWDFRFSVLVMQQQPYREEYSYSRQISMQSFESKVSYDSYRDEYNLATHGVFLEKSWSSKGYSLL